MKLMKLGLFGYAIMLVFFAGCKSKETTSAILHNSVGRYDLAIQTATEALAKDPTDAEAHFQLGISYSHLDSTGLAYENFMRAAELDPNQIRKKNVENNIQSNYAKHYNRALKVMKDEDKTDAVAEFIKATQADPREAKAFFQLAKVYSMMGESEPKYYNNAIANFDRVLDLATPADKHYIDALSLAGEVLAKSGRPEEAVSRFARLVEEDPTNYRVIEKLGYSRLDTKDWKGAAVFLDLSAQARSKIGAEDFNLYYNLGVANFQMGKEVPDFLPRAVDYYQNALNLEPNEPTTTYNIVATYVVGENWAEAVTWGERYVDLKPDDPNGWKLLSRSYTELGDQEKGRQCMARYAELVKQSD
ncbi:MAG: tetratricopeptide repeat protein [Candidatus Krumholzibacteria bacterium]